MLDPPATTTFDWPVLSSACIAANRAGPSAAGLRRYRHAAVAGITSGAVLLPMVNTCLPETEIVTGIIDDALAAVTLGVIRLRGRPSP